VIATVDLNIVLDVHCERAPFSTDSRVVLNLIEKREVIGVFASRALTTLFYIARKDIGRTKAEAVVAYVLKHFKIIGLRRVRWELALRAGFADFEDAAIATVAESSGSAVLITRNVPDFAKSKVRAVTPTEFIWQGPMQPGQTPP
jgi:predicted nucleic acid-binding protein